MTDEHAPETPLLKHSWLVLVIPIYMFAALYDIFKESPPFEVPATDGAITARVCGLVLCLLPFLLIARYYSKQKRSLRQEWKGANPFVKGISLLLAAGFLNAAFSLGMLAFQNAGSFTRVLFLIWTVVILLLKWPGMVYIGAAWWSLFKQKFDEFRNPEKRKISAFLFDALFTVLFAALVLFLIYYDCRGLISMFSHTL